MEDKKKERRPFDDKTSGNVSLRVAGTYLLLGTAWILFSDIILTTLAKGSQLISVISIVKGLTYVIVSSLVIYNLIHRSIREIQLNERKITESYQQLKITHDELSKEKEFNTVIIEKMLNAFALHRIILDETGVPVDYEFLDVNPAFEDFTGIKKEDIIGKRYSENFPSAEQKNWVKIYGEVALTGKPNRIIEYTEYFDRWVVVNAYSPKEGYFITVFNDITQIKKTEEELKEKNEEIMALYEELLTSKEELRQQYQELTVTQETLKKHYEELEDYQNKLHYSAYHDLLTGLPNRLSLYEKMSKYLDGNPDTRIAMLFIDLDNFKMINDTMGHTYGDQLLIYLGKRLSSLMVEKYEVHRLGGDEFIVCCYDFDNRSEICRLAEEILESFESPVILGDSMLHITVSIGVSVFPEDGANPDELLQSADIAMYKAKLSGKNRFVFYDEDMKKHVHERMTIEKHLRDALKNHELLLYYQPQISIDCGKICGFEALLRWNNPELGFIPPLKFISIAEETQLIIPIGEWVLREACSFLKRVQSSGNMDLIMAVNISILQLLQDNFVEMVLKTLEETGLQATCLELEITESVLMESYDIVTQKLNRLREAGIRIALDDFGQGYSSLSYLQKLPIHTLKIDKLFIDSIIAKETKTDLTGTIIDIGRKMGLTILAEGVETEEQLNYLKKHQCHKVQGYYYSRPLPYQDALSYCKNYYEAQTTPPQ